MSTFAFLKASFLNLLLFLEGIPLPSCYLSEAQCVTVFTHYAISVDCALPRKIWQLLHNQICSLQQFTNKHCHRGFAFLSPELWGCWVCRAGSTPAGLTPMCLFRFLSPLGLSNTSSSCLKLVLVILDLTLRDSVCSPQVSSVDATPPQRSSVLLCYLPVLLMKDFALHGLLREMFSKCLCLLRFQCISHT